jgi:kynurenine formamidase
MTKAQPNPFGTRSQLDLGPTRAVMFRLPELARQGLTNLDQLPATGAMIVSAPLKIKGGSGSPLRVLALLPS